MCLILFAYNNHPSYRLILAANRDEFYDRPTASAHFWEDDPGVLGGRDLKEGGTWLGISRTGKIAAITNYRNPSNRKERARSRGLLVSDFLRSRSEPLEYFEKIRYETNTYNDFNLLFGSRRQLCYASSQTGSCQILAPGTYGLSNRFLDTPWPKVESGRKALISAITDEKEFSFGDLFRILADRTKPDDQFLPDTGVGLEWERILSPIFISSPVYGTRSSTLLFIDTNDTAKLVERTYDHRESDAFQDKSFEIRLAG